MRTLGSAATDGRAAMRRGRAFTLIELLTVISIIGVLIAVVMPAVTSARQRGRITTCQARLYELAKAVSSYMDQNRDFFPLAADCQGPVCNYWNGHQYYGWNGKVPSPTGRTWNRPINAELGIEPSPVDPGLAKVARCPDDAGAPGQTDGMDEPLYLLLGTSYPLNPILCQGRYGLWRYRDYDLTRSQVLQPSRIVLLGDHPAFGLTYDEYWTGLRPGWHDQRFPAAAVAFADAHGEYIRKEGRPCGLDEWQWYGEASGPDFVRRLEHKADWRVYEECQ